ncbi:hypothetical protein [Methylorubrum aminovorans]|uniref:hypothetical protein n=1 Tax=Methylorubrum aminovorans TaxID=269069 RepID=UPI003D6680BB
MAQGIRLPAGPDKGVAPAQDEPGPGIRGGLRIVDGLHALGRRIEDPVEEELAAPVQHLEQERSAAAGRILGPQDEQVGLVLDHAAGVAGRQGDVDDAGIGGIGRVELAAGRADDALVAAGRAELGAVGKRLDAGDLDAGDARLGRRGPQSAAKCADHNPTVAHVRSLSGSYWPVSSANMPGGGTSRERSGLIPYSPLPSPVGASCRSVRSLQAATLWGRQMA